MAISWIYSDEGSVALDSETRLATVYDTQGQQVGEPRPYTPKENADEDARAVASIRDTNYAALIEKIPTALANNQTALTNLQSAYTTLDNLSRATWANQTQRDNALKSNSAQSAIIAQHAMALTRQNNALIRIVGGLLDSQSGT